MARILIVYGTSEGQTRKIAQCIGAVASARGHLVQVVDSRRLSDPLADRAFDACVVGASLHRGRYQTSVQHFVRDNLAFLNQVPAAFFSVSLVAASPDVDHRQAADELIERFLAETGWRPARTVSLAGALLYSRYGFLKRVLMRLIAWREGGGTDTTRDYEYTDWDAVETFTRGFLSDLVEQTGAEVRRETGAWPVHRYADARPGPR